MYCINFICIYLTKKAHGVRTNPFSRDGDTGRPEDVAVLQSMDVSQRDAAKARETAILSKFGKKFSVLLTQVKIQVL